MRYVKLREDLKASNIVMGCMRIADKPLTQVEKVIFEAMKAGVNTFDLADVYGGGDCENRYQHQRCQKNRYQSFHCVLL